MSLKGEAGGGRCTSNDGGLAVHQVLSVCGLIYPSYHFPKGAVMNHTLRRCHIG